jgi:hypothetical protein
LTGINVKGKQIKLDLGMPDPPWPGIYDLRPEQQIATIAVLFDLCLARPA